MKIGRNRLTELIMGCAIMISLVSNISFVRAEGAYHKSGYLHCVTENRSNGKTKTIMGKGISNGGKY
jgi:hypothetical protein